MNSGKPSIAEEAEALAMVHDLLLQVLIPVLPAATRERMLEALATMAPLAAKYPNPILAATILHWTTKLVDAGLADAARTAIGSQPPPST